MKKTIILLSAVLLLTGCSDGNPAVEEISADTAFYTYPAENAVTFDVSPNGTVYTIESENSNVLCSYTLSGERTEIAELPAGTDSIAYSNGRLYYTQTADNGTEIFSFDISAKSTEKLCGLAGLWQIKNLDIAGEKAYILGSDDTRSGVQGEYSDQFGTYSYNGEMLYRIDLSSGEATASPVDFPQAFCADENGVTVYAADMDGYYFTDFDNSHKQYNDLGNLTALEKCGGKLMFYSDTKIFKLCSGSENPEDGIAEALENVILLSGNDLRYCGGYGFLLNRYGEFNSSRLERFHTSDYIKSNNRIRFISAEYSFDEPFGCGYVIENKELSAEEFALAVMSQDKNYDICMINSAQDYSANIKNKGSFYPLNDVPGVAEYLEKCFPYVKEAAYTESGEIWMLPVVLNAGVVYYSPENCSAAGVELSDRMGYSSFIDQCKAAYNSDYKDGFSVHCYQLTQQLLFDYMTKCDRFNTSAFRNFAEFAKENMNITSFPEYLPISNTAENNLTYGDANGREYFLFGFSRESSWQKNYAASDFMRAVPAPSDEPGGKTPVTCAFITVNPASDELGSALDYISSLANYLSGQENSLMLADKSTYTHGFMSDLYGIYENGELCFNISSEIVFDDYISYCSGNITLDELVSESDRKLSAYLNE